MERAETEDLEDSLRLRFEMSARSGLGRLGGTRGPSLAGQQARQGHARKAGTHITEEVSTWNPRVT